MTGNFFLKLFKRNTSMHEAVYHSKATFIYLLSLLLLAACHTSKKISLDNTIGLPAWDSRPFGTNISGGEFAPNTAPGVFNIDYGYPTTAQLDYFKAKGFHLFRLPFLWERLQKQTGGPLDTTELNRLVALVDSARARNLWVIPDMHNYCRRVINGKMTLIGTNLKHLSDPSDNLIYEAHVYFDADASGSYEYSYDEEKTSPNTGIERIKAFVEWLKQNKLRGFVGEYGVPDNDPRWLVTLNNFLSYLKELMALTAPIGQQGHAGGLINSLLSRLTIKTGRKCRC